VAIARLLLGLKKFRLYLETLSSLDAWSRLRPPEAPAISARIDRIEQAMAQYTSAGAIQGSIPRDGGPPSVSRLGRAFIDAGWIDLKPAQ
jgi:hypothetical protein